MLTARDHTAVFEASPDAMLVVDSGGVIRDLNRQAIAMFGWSREEIEGTSFERLVPAPIASGTGGIASATTRPRVPVRWVRDSNCRH